MQTQEARCSAILVGLPFRGAWSKWGGVHDEADRAQATFLYRGVFDLERWTPAASQDEAWAESAAQAEAWVAVTAQSETWTERSRQSELWAEKTRQSETWTRVYGD